MMIILEHFPSISSIKFNYLGLSLVSSETAYISVIINVISQVQPEANSLDSENIVFGKKKNPYSLPMINWWGKF
jgi:hypothetical protein